MIHFTDQNFAAETAKGMSVIDMYADWCGPCKIMAPIFEQVSTTYEGKVKMGKMNVDNDPETPGKFSVSGIPSLIFLQDGKEVGRLVGFQSKDVLTQKITEIFGIK